MPRYDGSVVRLGVLEDWTGWLYNEPTAAIPDPDGIADPVVLFVDTSVFSARRTFRRYRSGVLLADVDDEPVAACIIGDARLCTEAVDGEGGSDFEGICAVKLAPARLRAGN